LKKNLNKNFNKIEFNLFGKFEPCALDAIGKPLMNRVAWR
jgi:hypothetical protein